MGGVAMTVGTNCVRIGISLKLILALTILSAHSATLDFDINGAYHSESRAHWPDRDKVLATHDEDTTEKVELIIDGSNLTVADTEEGSRLKDQYLPRCVLGRGPQRIAIPPGGTAQCSFKSIGNNQFRVEWKMRLGRLNAPSHSGLNNQQQSSIVFRYSGDKCNLDSFHTDALHGGMPYLDFGGANKGVGVQQSTSVFSSRSASCVVR
jgi:hypothetical protein